MSALLGLLVVVATLWLAGWVLYRLFSALGRGFRKLTRRHASPKSKPPVRAKYPKVVLKPELEKPSSQRETTQVSTSTFVIGEKEPARGYVIPERPSRNEKAPADEARFDVSVSYVGPGAGFVEDAKKYVDRTHEKTFHVPFNAYWSTYRHMNKEQAAWYFYWRSQLRQGTPLPTDLSYIFVHIYECLHLIGFERADEALSHLKRLWASYRQAHPSLDNYLQHWVLDMVAYYDIGTDPLVLVQKMMDDGVCIYERDLAIAAWLRTGSFEALDFDLITTVAKFDPRSGKFYQEFDDKTLIERSYQLAFQAADTHHREIKGKGLFEKYLNKQPKAVKRQAFEGAVFGCAPRVIVVAEVRRLTNSQKLQTLLESILKFTENVLRRRTGFGGSRRGIDLPDDLEAYLQRVLEPSPKEGKPQRTLTIDLEKVQSLKAESHAIRAQLIATDASEAHRAKSERFSLPEGLPPGQLTDVDQVASVLDHLSSAALTLLHELDARGWEQQISERVTVQEIHQLSDAYLGESLIVKEADQMVVVEDYRDELAFLFLLPEYARPRVTQSFSASSDSGLDAGWLELKSSLTSLHLQALAKIQRGCDARALETFAAEHFTMKDLLVEEINERAMTALGDNIIDPYADPLAIYDEHHANVSTLVSA